MSEACETISIKGGGDVRNDILNMIAVKAHCRQVETAKRNRERQRKEDRERGLANQGNSL